MSNSVSLSVIVPIYNVQKFINQCIDSIINQTKKDIEFIFIDDGSPDDCGKIIDEYAKKDTRIIAVHQKNSGYGHALNKGIHMAHGEYIGIIESDDWIENDMYEKLYDAAKIYNADIARCGFYIYNSQESNGEMNTVWNEVEDMFHEMPDGPFCPRDYKKIFMYHSALWTYIYKSDLLKSTLFNEKSRSYQDYPFIFEVLAKAKSMVIVKEFLHHYRMEQGQGSSSTTKSIKSMQMFDMTTFAFNRLAKENLLKGIEKEFFQHSVLANKYFYRQTPEENQKEYASKAKDFFEENISVDVFENMDDDSKSWLREIGILKPTHLGLVNRLMRYFKNGK